MYKLGTLHIAVSTWHNANFIMHLACTFLCTSHYAHYFTRNLWNFQFRNLSNLNLKIYQTYKKGKPLLMIRRRNDRTVTFQPCQLALQLCNFATLPPCYIAKAHFTTSRTGKEQANKETKWHHHFWSCLSQLHKKYPASSGLYVT